MPKLPKLLLIVLASLSTLCLNAVAQVYESTDAQGNVTFSDTPTPGSRAVTIEAPNLSDAVKVPPPSAEPADEPQPEVASQQPPPPPTTNSDLDNDVYYDDGGGLYPRRYLYRDHYQRPRYRAR